MPDEPRADRMRMIKIPHALFERCNSLQETLASDPNIGPMLGRMSVVAVVRVALIEGLQVLEERYGVGADNAR